MSVFSITTAIAGLALLSVAAPGVVSAQTAYAPRGQSGYPTQGYAGRAYDYGSSDYRAQASGCVKECSRDSNPCDPPSFKAADGRCNYED